MESNKISIALFDNHTHSYFSDDGKMSIDECAKAAEEMGLAGLSITDHYDFDVPSGVMKFQFDPIEQQREIDRVASENRKITLLKGIEIGVQSHCIEEIKSFSKRYSFDCVIASLHFINGLDPYHGNYYTNYNYKEAYGKYLEEIYRCISLFEDFDILGHFDYIARYSPYAESTIYLSDFEEIISEILKLIVNKGKTFEINTKTYQIYRGKEPLLDLSILKKFVEFGGEAISFGSDAHSTNRLGENFNRFIEIAKSAGIKYEAYFHKREMNYLSI